MNYNKVFIDFFLIILITTLILSLINVFLKSRLQIIILSEIKNKDINISLKIKYLFGLINIDKEIYPPKKKTNAKKTIEKNPENKKIEKGKNKKSPVLTSDIVDIYKLIRNVEIYEFYSKLEIGSENIEFTSFLYVFINTIYGFLANYIDSTKMYLGVTPNFTKNCIIGSFKIHIKPSIKDLGNIGRKIYKLYKNSKGYSKGGNDDEGNRINTEPNGNNT
ncbi:MAG: DUF2953 domain-containing protein [Romboutsia sp.]